MRSAAAPAAALPLRGTSATRSLFPTSDGASLSVLEAGRGPTVLMLPGWSQSAALFAPQLEALRGDFHCVALDHRGHGESGDVGHGLRLSRLAQDVREFLLARDLQDVVLLGHSMGAAVMWAYWDAFGKDRLAKMVAVDQPCSLMVREDETEQERIDSGALFTWQALREQCSKLRGPAAEAETMRMVGGMLSGRLPEAVREWVFEENLKFPRAHAAALLANCASQDWRDVAPRVDLPTLVVGGRASCVPWQSQVWLHRQLANGRLEIFEEEDGGYHFMFLESPDRFNSILRSFLMGP